MRYCINICISMGLKKTQQIDHLTIYVTALNTVCAHIQAVRVLWIRARQAG